jgi:hypothetical protein
MIIIKDKVKKKLDKLNISKSPDPDGIHPRVLKEVSMSLCLSELVDSVLLLSLNKSGILLFVFVLDLAYFQNVLGFVLT